MRLLEQQTRVFYYCTAHKMHLSPLRMIPSITVSDLTTVQLTSQLLAWRLSVEARPSSCTYLPSVICCLYLTCLGT